MTTAKPVDEADLHAYVDRQLEEGAGADVEAWLAGNPDDLAKVEAWRLQRRELHARFDGVLAEPLPAAIEAALGKHRFAGLTRRWKPAAAAIALFVAGAAVGWGAHEMQARRDLGTAQLVRQAVAAHVVYVPEVVHPVEVKASEEAHLVAWLSKRLGNPVRAPKLAKVGFALVGGRLLPDSGSPAAQFMYEDAGGRRVTLYVTSGRQGGDTAFRFVSERDVAAFYWIDGPLAYAVTGRMPREQLLTLARAVYEDLAM